MQLLAMLTMLIDHIGLVFYPDEQLWRIIGRISFPLYAYAIVLGYNRTSSVKAYLIRLVLIAAISQLPYMWALQSGQINVVGTFVVCLLVIWAIDNLRSRLLAGVIVLAAIFMLEYLSFDYGCYALLLILIYQYMQLHGAVIAHAHVSLNLSFWGYKGWDIQMYSIIPTIAVQYMPLLIQSAEEIRIPRWIWRSFYPLHLTAIAAISFVWLLGE